MNTDIKEEKALNSISKRIQGGHENILNEKRVKEYSVPFHLELCMHIH